MGTDAERYRQFYENTPSQEPVRAAPTQQETPAEVPADGKSEGVGLLDFVAGIGREVVEREGTVGKVLAKLPSIGPAFGMAEAMRQGLEGDPEGGMEAAQIAAIDSATLGVGEQVASGLDVLDGVVKGEIPMNTDDLVEAYTTKKDEFNRSMREIRDENRAMSFFGDVAGSMVPGGIIFKGVNRAMDAAFGLKEVARSTPIFRNFILAPAVAGGGEAAAYRANSGGSLDEVLIDAKYGAIGGAAFASLFGLAGGLGKVMFGKTKSGMDTELGMELYRTLQANAAQRGENLTPAMVVKMMEDAGPDKVLSDVFPELLPKLRSVGRTDDKVAREAVLGLVRARGDAATSFRETVMRTVKDPTVRTPTIFKKSMDDLTAQLKPRYEELFTAKNASGWYADSKVLYKNIGKALNMDQTKAGSDLGAVKKILNEVSDSKGVLSFRGVHDAKRKLNQMIGARIAANSKRLQDGKTALPLENFQNAQKFLSEILDRDEMYAKLNSEYGTLANIQKAYDLGRNIIKKTDLEGGDAQALLARQMGLKGEAAQEFFATERSAEQMKALMEGAKYQLSTYARGAGSATGSPEGNLDAIYNSVAKAGRLEDLRALVGNEAVDTMMKTIDDAYRSANTALAAQQGLNKTPMNEGTRSVGQTIADMQISSSIATGDTKGVAPWFAFRRLLGHMTGKGERTGKEVTNAVQGMAGALTNPQGVQPMMDAITRGATPAATAQGIAGAAYGSQMGSEVDALAGDVANSDTTKQIMDYLGYGEYQ